MPLSSKISDWRAKRREGKKEEARQADEKARAAAEEASATLDRFTTTLFQSEPFSSTVSGSQTQNPSTFTGGFTERATEGSKQTGVIENANFEVYDRIGPTGLWIPRAPEGYYYKYEPNGEEGQGYYREEKVEGVARPTTAPKFISYAAIVKKVNKS